MVMKDDDDDDDDVVGEPLLRQLTVAIPLPRPPFIFRLFSCILIGVGLLYC